jgi:pimeloyl-ACP methyl ester carboxylesterase
MPAQYTYTAGSITDSIACTSQPQHTYCIYLPSSYNPSKKYPTVFIHDPAARGKLAVEVFAAAAEKYQYVLACSNMIQNGADGAKLMHLSGEMQNDVMQKISADTSRIYLCGFSGGSRLSTAVALHQKNIAGVIAVGAGLPRAFNALEFDTAMVYALVTGIYDMNYTEQLNLHKTFRVHGIPTRLFTFDGGHQWCDPVTADAIFEWLQYKAMHDGLLQYDSTLSNHFIYQHITVLDSLLAVKDVHKLYLQYVDLHNDAMHLQNAHDALLPVISFLNSSEAEKKLVQILELLSNEDELKQTYVEYIRYRMPGALILDSTFLKKDAWWKQTAHRLQKQTKDENPAKANSAARLYDFLCRNSWEQGDILYEAGALTAAREMYYLLALLDESSKLAWYKLAKTEARLGNENTAVKLLERAAKNGFNNHELLLTDEAFSSIWANEKFIMLLENMKITK